MSVGMSAGTSAGRSRRDLRRAANLTIKINKERRNKAADILESLLLDLIPEGFPQDNRARRMGIHRMLDLLRAVNPAVVRKGTVPFTKHTYLARCAQEGSRQTGIDTSHFDITVTSSHPHYYSGGKNLKTVLSEFRACPFSFLPSTPRDTSTPEHLKDSISTLIHDSQWDTITEIESINPLPFQKETDGVTPHLQEGGRVCGTSAENPQNILQDPQRSSPVPVLRNLWPSAPSLTPVGSVNTSSQEISPELHNLACAVPVAVELGLRTARAIQLAPRLNSNQLALAHQRESTFAQLEMDEAFVQLAEGR